MTVLEKTCSVGVVFLAVLHQVSAQTVYTPAVNYIVGVNPVSPLVVDVNGDGKPDIICANYGNGGIFTDGNTLSILTNAGNGRFALASSPLVGSGPRSITAGDINGDGKSDLVCANSGDNTVSVLTNNGTGTFVLSTNLNMGNYALNNYPTSVWLWDANSDGKPDLVINMMFMTEVVTLTNNGSGGFNLYNDWFPGGFINIGIPPDLTTTVDVNGDGQPDLISGTLSGNTLSVSFSIPTLAINNTNSNATVFWPSGWINWKLLQSSNLMAWTTNNYVFDDGTNVSCTVTSSSAPNHLFFRLAN